MSLALVDVEGVDLGIPSLDDLIRSHKVHLELSGKDGEIVSDELERLKRAYRINESSHGVDSEEDAKAIARELRCRDREVLHYANGGIPRIVRKAIRIHKKYGIPEREESYYFAYLLGIITSLRHRKGTDKGKARGFIIEGDRELFPKITAICDRFSIKYTQEDNGRIVIEHSRASKYISEVTKVGNGVPWEHLVTSEERLAFLSAYLDRKGAIGVDQRGRCYLDLRRLRNDLFEDLVLLFAEQGIFPTFNTNLRDISVKYKQQLSHISNMLSSPSRKEKIKEAFGNCDENYPTLSIDECREVIEFKKIHRKRTREKLRELGIEVSKGSESRVVTSYIISTYKRYLAVEDLREQRPDIDVIGYCYREIRVSSKAARALASVYRIDKIRRFDPNEIKEWAQVYDEDSSVEINLEKSILQTVETGCRKLANAVIQGNISAAEARESIEPLAKASGLKIRQVDDLYWSTYREELHEQRGEE